MIVFGKSGEWYFKVEVCERDCSKCPLKYLCSMQYPTLYP